MNDFLRLRIRPWGLLTAVGFLAFIGSMTGFLGRWAWWLDLGAHFRVQYVFLFGLLAICYWIGRRRAWAIGALAFAVLNAIPVALFLLPPVGYEKSTGQSVRIALINVNTQHGDPERVAAFIEKEQPDLVVLEEINDRWVRLLAPVLEKYPVRAIATRDDNFGMALLSRMPASIARVVSIGSAEVPSMVADIVLNGRPVTLLATHPLPPGGREYSYCRNEQLQQVAQWARGQERPLILVGDLNVTPWSPHYHDFIRDSGLINSSQGRAIHATWPSFLPMFLIPIDHCLHTDEIGIKAKRVGESIGSDHLPVVVDVVLKSAGAAAEEKIEPRMNTDKHG